MKKEMSNYITENSAFVVDWEDFRRETAKYMLPVTSQMKITKEGKVVGSFTKKGAARLAIEYADELIKQLKEEEK